MHPSQHTRSFPFRRRCAAVILTMLATLVPGCGRETTQPEPGIEISPQALAYLTEALDVMQRFSINRNHIEWPAFRAEVLRGARGAQTFRDTYPALRYAVRALGDNHSYFREPSEVGGASAFSATPPTSPPRADRVHERIGYLRVPGYRGFGTDSAATAFAQQLQDMLRDLDRSAPTCGWIVDLRPNTGGNMGPMLLGVGPLLGSGVVGYNVDPDSVWVPWRYDRRHVPAPYEMIHPDPPVAVLTSSLTISSGEAIATTFRGRPDTRSFGASTGGLTTGIRGHTLPDGAVIGVAASVFADRTRRIYGGVLVPDQPVPGVMQEDPNAGDAVVDAAVSWLLDQAACQ
jgi:carboxyl-terminal processing protease